jgi:hypothetical protein
MIAERRSMSTPKPPRSRLLAPLIYLAALLLLIEEWFWDTGVALGRRIAAWPPLNMIETRIRALRPYPALCVFLLPTLLLFPVKLLALFAIASGHVFTGVCAIVVAKIGGAALLARLYLLTRASLLTLPWFARWHNAFIALKDRWIGRLKATRAYRHAQLVMARLRRVGKEIAERLRSRSRGGRHATRPTRIIRRLLALRRARRRP